MDPLGYMVRLAEGYMLDITYYTPLYSVSASMAAQIRTAAMYHFLPTSMHLKRSIHASELPHCYHNYKGKCLCTDGPGLACDRDHSHERDIISASADPLKVHLSVAGRGLRLAKKLAGDPGWILWDSSKFTPTLLERIAKLIKWINIYNQG